MFDSQELNRLRDLVTRGAVLDKSTVLSMLTELEARGNRIANLEKQIQRVRELASPNWCLSIPEQAKQELLKALDGEA